MKKVFALLLIFSMTFVLLSGCKKNVGTDEDETNAGDTYEIALVTDVGNIDDQSFNQGSWEGVVAYAEDNDTTYAYYRPSEDSTESRIETVKSAIDKGAKIIVCPGYLFGEVLASIQEEYSQICFLGIDVAEGDMVNLDGNAVAISNNVALVTYREEQAGYLAGYAAVKDGFTKLGFLGGMAVPAVIRYGYGFVQGANTAAKELKNSNDVEVNYWYSGVFNASDEIQTKMAGWYTAGTEVVFACGGGIYLSATAAAEAANKKVIGVDVNQANQSNTIITSALKELKNSIVTALDGFYNNNRTWSVDYAGKVSVFGANEKSIGLPTDESSWRFTKFTVDEYQTLLEKIKNGEENISDKADPDVHPDVTIKVNYMD